MAEAIGSSYDENQSSSEPTTDSDSDDDEYPPGTDTSAYTTLSSIKLEMKWLKRNKRISRQERRRIQREIQKGRKPGQPMTSPPNYPARLRRCEHMLFL